MKKLIVLMLLALGLSSPLLAVTVSTTTSVDGPADAIFLRKNETLTFTLTGTFTGNAFIEKSFDGTNWSSVGISSTNNAGATFTGTIDTMQTEALYRWNGSTITAGSFVFTLADNDDFVAEQLNNKVVPIVQYYDDSLRVVDDQGNTTTITPTNITITTITVTNLVQGAVNFSPTNSGTTFAVEIGTEITRSEFPESYVILTSTGDIITMTAAPAISTATANAGDIYIIQSTTATITFQDDGTLAGSALQLGASTRALGVGDILAVIFRDGFWWELFFANN